MSIVSEPGLSEAGGSEAALCADSEMSRWRCALEPYTRPRLARSVGEAITSVVMYLAMSVAVYVSISVSPFLALALGVPTAGFLLRTYIVFHDCSHGSFLPYRRGNEWLGSVCGFLVLSPFVRWRHDHAVHHATAGDLDRRGVGDLPTLTVAEFRSRSRRGQLGYRMFRNPAVMFGLGPIFAMVIGPRIFTRSQRPRMRRSVMITDAALVVVFGSLVALLGVADFLLTWGPASLLAGSVGIWLFYVQHQFEDVYWERGEEWSYADAALSGSSYLKLPKVLQFFTGNIGLHHVHHMSSRIPNYNLQSAHDAIPAFHDVPTLSLWDGLRACRLKLWDEDGGRLVTFHQARTSQGWLRAPAPAPAPAS